MWQNTIITVLPDDLSFRSNNWSFFRLYKILQYLHSADMQLLFQLLCLFLISTLTIVANFTPYWALDQEHKGSSFGLWKSCTSEKCFPHSGLLTVLF